MIYRTKPFLSNRRMKTVTAVAVVLSLILAGLVVAADRPVTNIAVTTPQGTRTETTVTAPETPRSFADLAEKLSPTVVNIKVTRVAKQAAWQGRPMPEGPFGEMFKRFFKEMPQDSEQFKQQGAGSGVIISKDGYILTNNHVIDGADEVVVTLSDKQEYVAEIVGRDAKTDLAVLKINADVTLPMASMGDSDALRVGHWVLAIGNPFGLSHTVTSGIVSAKGRVIGAGPYDDFIQTDASINPGNSGGPLFNMNGEVVGINTAIIPNGQGIGFAIPVNTAKALVPQMVSNGVVTRGYLGVSIQSIDPDLAKALKLTDRNGALVAEVEPGSPADKAGIRAGDVLLAFNDKTVDRAHDLPAMVAQTPVGEDVTIVILRDGEQHRLPLTVGKLASDESEIEAATDATKGKWGLRLQTLTPEIARQHRLSTEHGVLVVGVQPDSAADKAGIHAGDILVEVDHHAVTSLQDVKQALAKDKDEDSLLVRVKRGKGSLYVAMAR